MPLIKGLTVEPLPPTDLCPIHSFSAAHNTQARNMHFAQILLPAILLAVCRTHALLEGVVANGGDDFLSTNDATLGIDDAAASIGNQWYRRLETQQAREKLIAQYRFMIAKSLVRLRDACKVFDWLAHEQPQSLFGGKGEQMPGDMRGTRYILLFSWHNKSVFNVKIQMRPSRPNASFRPY